MLLFSEVTLAAPLTLFAMHGSFLPEEKRDAAVAAHFKAKSIKALQALELVMSDGRKYIAGKEFTAAGTLDLPILTSLQHQFRVNYMHISGTMAHTHASTPGSLSSLAILYCPLKNVKRTLSVTQRT